VYKGLPEIAYAVLPSSEGTDHSQTIAIKRGKSGYFKISQASCTAEEMNRINGVSKAQAAAMLAGSLFGWDVPGADPERYDVDGNVIGSPQARDNEAGR
jgi:hypothetical protein